MKPTVLFAENSAGARFLALLAAAAICCCSVSCLSQPVFVTRTADDFAAGSLRFAVNNPGPDNTIVFSSTLSGQTILLTLGDLQLNVNNLVIIGPGATNVTVENFTGRVFHVTPDGMNHGVHVAITGLTITGILHGTPGTDGNVASPNGNDADMAGPPMGGGILLEGSGCVLTVSNCYFLGCQVIAGNGGDAYTNDMYGFQANGGNGSKACGGAICNNGGDLLLSEDAFKANIAVGGNGGFGAYGGNGGKGGAGQGGALCDVYGNEDVKIVNCTFYTNSAYGGNSGKGGDAWAGHVGPANGGAGGTAGDADGGAIFIDSACPNPMCTGIVHSTIDANQLLPGHGRSGGTGVNGGNPGATGANGSALGGGIYHHSSIMGGDGKLPMNNTIVAANFVTIRNNNGTYVSEGPDFYGEVDSFGYNFIGLLDAFSSTWDTAAVGHDMLGTATALDPQLGPFQFNNQALTPTMAPAPCSPVVDAGTAAGYVADQIHQPRPKNVSGMTVTMDYDGSDIGAYELQTFPTNSTALGIVESADRSQITISWPVAYSCFTLQQTPSLVSSNWTTVTNPVSVSGNQCQVSISPVPLAGNLFFRLYHP